MTLPVLLMLVHDAEGVRSLERQDPDSPQISMLDLGVTRGDGVFESIGVVDGRAQALGPHLDRLANSARILDLPTPDLTVWRDAIVRSITEAGDAAAGAELMVKIVLTRGIEGGDAATGWVYCAAAADFTSARESGIRVVSLDRGYRSDVAETSPWLLQGAKTLSYALNKAVVREAVRRGADDVILVSSDGFVLEGPTSSIIARIDGGYVTTPSSFGVLEGTTQHAFFAEVEKTGASTAYRPIPLDELRRAEAIWSTSSSLQLAPVVALDGTPVPHDRAFTAAMLTALLAR